MSPEITTTDLPIQYRYNETGIVFTTIEQCIIAPNYTGMYVIEEEQLVSKPEIAESFYSIGEIFYLKDGVKIGSNTFAELRAIWIIQFTQCIQHIQIANESSGYMDSTVHFSAFRGDDYMRENIRHFTIPIRHRDFSHEPYEETVLDVTFPEELNGRINYQEFREAAEQYYRKSASMGGMGPMMYMGGIMQNNTYQHTYTVHVHALNVDSRSAW